MHCHSCRWILNSVYKVSLGNVFIFSFLDITNIFSNWLHSYLLPSEVHGKVPFLHILTNLLYYKACFLFSSFLLSIPPSFLWIWSYSLCLIIRSVSLGHLHFFICDLFIYTFDQFCLWSVASFGFIDENYLHILYADIFSKTWDLLF